MRQVSSVFALFFVLGFTACKREQAEKAPTAASASAAALGPVAPPQGRNWPMPSGPVLAMLAGQGVGSIRIGANLATIQRHMALPCDVKTPTVCRYIGRGVEFHLKNGVTEKVSVHRAGRAAGKDSSGQEREYGFFNGAIPPDLRFGMIPSAIQEHLGPAERVDKLDGVPPDVTVERHFYPGIVVEYDRHQNGNLIMGGVTIEKPASEASTPASSSAPKP